MRNKETPEEKTDRLIEALIKERRPPYEELKDDQETRSLLPVARLLKVLQGRQPAPRISRFTPRRSSWRPVLVFTGSLLIVLLIVFLLIPTLSPNLLALYYARTFIGSSPYCYTVQLEVMVNGETVEKERARVWYISPTNFRIQTTNEENGKVDVLIADNQGVWQYFPAEGKKIFWSFYSLPPERSRFLLADHLKFLEQNFTAEIINRNGKTLLQLFPRNAISPLWGQSRSAELFQEIDEQTGYPTREIFRLGNLEAVMSWEDLTTVSFEEIEPFTCPEATEVPQASGTMQIYLEEKTITRGNPIILVGTMPTQPSFLTVLVDGQNPDSLVNERVFYLKEGHFRQALYLPSLASGPHTLTCQQLVPFAPISQEQNLEFQVQP
jgi:hypothetical protein